MTAGPSELVSEDPTPKQLGTKNQKLRDLLEKTCYQMQRDYALKKLMDKENGDLREQLFHKKKKPAKRYASADASRHMTSEESLEALAYNDWRVKWLDVMKELKDMWKEKAKTKKAADERQRQLNREEHERQKELRDRQKELDQHQIH
ncbi:hypothetical protein K435DRAFT_877085 [Dendrothele bispora CBS 962.96]|uniref:Uncharacterized protein n=1 Tax=Dendrothele bispora (strain CBS 962.96) TaxID=1314807 RepID=A0A4S8KQL9_DENBC|nr:hypothetical protein K435DRAFT_877085 [Dendrothele bispora CBS 962.96]